MVAANDVHCDILTVFRNATPWKVCHGTNPTRQKVLSDLDYPPVGFSLSSWSINHCNNAELTLAIVLQGGDPCIVTQHGLFFVTSPQTWLRRLVEKAISRR